MNNNAYKCIVEAITQAVRIYVPPNYHALRVHLLEKEYGSTKSPE